MPGLGDHGWGPTGGHAVFSGASGSPHKESQRSQALFMGYRGAQEVRCPAWAAQGTGGTRHWWTAHQPTAWFRESALCCPSMIVHWTSQMNSHALTSVCTDTWRTGTRQGLGRAW